MEGLGQLIDSIMNRLSPEARKDLLELLEIRRTAQASPIGAILVGIPILEGLGLPQYIDKVLEQQYTPINQLQKGWKEATDAKAYPVPSFGTILTLLVADMIASPGRIPSVSKFEEAAKQWNTGFFLGIEPSLLHDDRIGSAMMALGNIPENLEDAVYTMPLEIAKKAGIPFNHFVAGTTILELEGDLANSSKVGPGRDQNSFSQLVIGLVIAAGSKVPVGFDVLADPTDAANTLPDIYEKIHKVADDGPVELLMERIYPTAGNILFLKEKEAERMVYWISPLQMSVSKKRVRAAIDRAWEENAWKPIQYRTKKEKKAKIDPPMQAYETSWVLSETIQTERKPRAIKTREIEVRCVFYRHKGYAEKEAIRREIRVQQLENELKKHQAKLNKCNSTELACFKKQLKKTLKAFSQMIQFLKIRLSQTEDGIISFSWTWDKEKLEKEKRYDGLVALLSNYQKKVRSNQLIKKYVSRDQVEVNFEDLRGILNLERILARREERIETYIFLKILSLFVLAYLRFIMGKEGVKVTEETLREALENLDLLECVVDPLGIKMFRLLHDTEMNRRIRELCNLDSPEIPISELNRLEDLTIEEALDSWNRDWLAKQKSR